MDSGVTSQLDTFARAYLAPFGWKLLGAAAVWVIGAMIIGIVRNGSRRLMISRRLDTTLATYLDTSLGIIPRSCCSSPYSVFSASRRPRLRHSWQPRRWRSARHGRACWQTLPPGSSCCFCVRSRSATASRRAPSPAPFARSGSLRPSSTPPTTCASRSATTSSSPTRSGTTAQTPTAASRSRRRLPTASIRSRSSAAFPDASVLKQPAAAVEILSFNATGVVLAVRCYCENDHYGQVYFETSRVVSEVIGDAGYSSRPAEMPAPPQWGDRAH